MRINDLLILTTLGLWVLPVLCGINIAKSCVRERIGIRSAILIVLTLLEWGAILYVAVVLRHEAPSLIWHALWIIPFPFLMAFSSVARFSQRHQRTLRIVAFVCWIICLMLLAIAVASFVHNGLHGR